MDPIPECTFPLLRLALCVRGVSGGGVGAGMGCDVEGGHAGSLEEGGGE